MILMKQDSMEGIRKSSDEDQNCVHKNVHEKMDSREHQTDILPNLEYDDKLQKVSKSKIDQQEESRRNEGHRKVKVEECSHHIEGAQESIQNCEADENEQNGKRIIIKVEKFECSDDMLPHLAVEHNESEQSRENKTNMLVSFEDRCDKLEIVSESRIYQMEENKQNGEIKKIKEYEFYRNIEAPQESIQNFEADENEQNGKRMIIKVEKFEHNDDILPPIAVEHNEPEQSSENKTNVLVKSEHYYDKLTQTSQVSFNQPEEYEVNKGNKDCTTIVSSAVYEISGECNSSRKPYSKQRRRGGNFSEKPKVTHTGEKPFACNLCSYRSAHKSCLNIHKVTHTGEKPFACNLCSYKSALKSSLQRHQLTHTGDKAFACNLCSYKSAQKSSLNVHKRSHTGENLFACNLCSYKSAKKSNLHKHQLTHTGEKPFACNLCSYKSAQKSSLQRHQLAHTGEKSFACNLCSYKSAHKSSLNIHKLKHTGEKPFSCNLCSYKSAHKLSLNIHKLKHTGEKPFACNMCSFKSAHKLSLNRHTLKHQ